MVGAVKRPINNPLLEEVTEVEVTDPTHPLFGRRFPLLSVSYAPNSVLRADDTTKAVVGDRVRQ